MKTIALLCALGFANFLLAQNVTVFATGNANDVQTDHEFGLLLAGGGGDNDDAMRWLLQRAAGGDVVVLRASGSDGYNDYLFSELNVPVNSVTTLLFNGAYTDADSSYAQQIREAEAVFLAGGDQRDYVDYWRGTPIETAINYLLTEKRAAVGGTSAGMAILGQLYYAPTGGSVNSDEALANPYIDFLENGLATTPDFLQTPFLENTITDTHWADRDREGRTVAFLARLSAAQNTRTYAITCNEYTAVGIDSLGIARVFGETPQYPDYAHFLAVNCQDEYLPETLASGTPLHWQRGGAAVKVYRVGGTPSGNHTFNLNTWTDGTGGSWQNWSVVNGTLETSTIATSDCAETLTAEETPPPGANLRVYPNPVKAAFHIVFPNSELNWTLYDALGGTVRSGTQSLVDVALLPPGIYHLHVTQGESVRLVISR